MQEGGCDKGAHQSYRGRICNNDTNERGLRLLEMASTGKQIVMVGRPEVLSQSPPMFQVQTLCCLPEISKCIGAEL